MREAIIPSLIFAMISALTFLAYNHPKRWKEISLPISIGGALILMFLMGWNLAISKATIALIPLVRDYDQLKRALSPFDLDGWIWLGLGGWYLYFILLNTYVTRLKELEKVHKAADGNLIEK